MHNVKSLSGVAAVTPGGHTIDLDLFAGKMNHNFIVAGNTPEERAGHVRTFASNVLNRKGRVALIDDGNVDDFAALNAGELVAMDIARPISVNTLWGFATEAELFYYRVELISLVLELTAETLNGDARLKAHAIIDRALRQAWHEHKEGLGLEHVFNHIPDEAAHLKQPLEEVAIGQYAGWFNGKPDVDVTGSLLVFSLGGLEPHHVLKTAVAAALGHLVMQAFYLAPKTAVKMLVYGSGSQFLGSEGFCVNMETLQRRSRRFGGSFGLVLKSLADVGNSDAASRLAENSEWILLGGHSAEDLPALQRLGDDSIGVANLPKRALVLRP